MKPRLAAAAIPALVAALYAADARAEFLSTPVTTATVGEPYVYDVTASGSGEVEITAPNGLPPWLTLTRTGNGTATLSGTPRSGDTGEGITLRSEDTTCRIFLILCYDFQTFDITIVENRPPEIVPPGLTDASAVEGEPFTLDVSGAFSDPDGDALTFTARGLPPGFQLEAGAIAGTATNADALASPFEITVTADDGKGGRASDTFQLSVSALDRAEISLQSIEASPAPALRGDPVEWTFTVANEGPAATGSVDLVVEFRGNALTFTDHPCTLTVADDRQRLECTLEPIESGGSGALTLTASAAQAGDAYVTAEVSSPGVPLDPSGDNNGGAYSLNVAQAVNAEAAQTLPGVTATSASAADLDGDEFDDVVVTTVADEPTSIHLNLENPDSLHPELSGAGDSRRGLSTLPMSLDDATAGTDAALADLDNDGDVDLVVANGPGAPGSVWLNNGDGSMETLTTLGSDSTDTRAVDAADLDGDGFADIVFANAAANEVYMNQGGGGFEQAALPDEGGAASSRDVELVDVVGSPLPDLIFANDDGPAVLYENLGDGTFGAPATIDAGPASSVASGDFNGDDYVDLVLGRGSPGPSGLPSNPVYMNNGSGGFVSVGALGASPTVDVLTGDMDGDGAVDVVAINATGAHQVFLGDGNGDFALHRSLFVSRGAAGAAVARIGLRQQADIVVGGAESAAVFFNDSGGGLGLGDTTKPVIELVGDQEIALEVEGTYTDPGATASDDVDGTLTPVVDNPVDPEVIGTYTVTYTAVDGAGNAAIPVTRTVKVNAREASGGGGGGAAGLALVALLVAGLSAVRVRRRGLPRPE